MSAHRIRSAIFSDLARLPIPSGAVKWGTRPAPSPGRALPGLRGPLTVGAAAFPGVRAHRRSLFCGRRADVLFDRPWFTFNPTDCAKLEITGSIASEGGAQGREEEAGQARQVAQARQAGPEVKPRAPKGARHPKLRKRMV